MDTMDETSDEPVAGALDGADNTSSPAYRPRGYQLEMLEASLKENVIVAVCFVLMITL